MDDSAVLTAASFALGHLCGPHSCHPCAAELCILSTHDLLPCTLRIKDHLSLETDMLITQHSLSKNDRKGSISWIRSCMSMAH